MLVLFYSSSSFKTGGNLEKLLVLVLFYLLYGCASPSSFKQSLYKIEDQKQGELDQDKSWHYLRIQWKWNQYGAPDWPLDLIAAHGIISPMLTEKLNSVKLWRFHRRAVHDQTGHQLSFIFYSTPELASGFWDEIRYHPTIFLLKKNGLLKKLRIELGYEKSNGVLEATSDSSWPIELKKAWPIYMYGASNTWLNLIDEYSDKLAAPSPGDFLEIKTHYENVDSSLQMLWKQYGQHAYFHHLNAIFEYEPILIRTEIDF